MRVRRGVRTTALTVGAAALAIASLSACQGTHSGHGGDGAASAQTPSNDAASQSPSSSGGGPTPPSASGAASASSPSASPSPTATPSPGVLPVPGASGALHVFADVVVRQASTGLVLAAEGSNGAVFVTAPGETVVWVVEPAGNAGVAEHAPAGVDALAVDTAYLYVACGEQLLAYSRQTGDLARQWALPAGKGVVRQIAVTGRRLWAAIGPQGTDPSPTPETLVEIDPSASALLRQLSVPNSTAIAGGPTGLYYVVSSKTLVEQTDAGTTKSAPVNDAVNLELSGSAAIQVDAVDGERVLVHHDAGQGLDAVLSVYSAQTLSGPTQVTPYGAGYQLAVTPNALLVLSFESDTCAGSQACLSRFDLGTGPQPSGVSVQPGTLVGPYPAVVAEDGGVIHVVRFN